MWGDQNAYAGEFDPASQKKKLFGKVKNWEIILTKDWFEDRFNDVSSCDSEPEEAAAESSRGWRSSYLRESQPDKQLMDLLKYRADVITRLDMKAVKKTKEEPTLVGLIAGLKNLRSIVLRAEFLPITKAMRQLESVEMHVS